MVAQMRHMGLRSSDVFEQKEPKKDTISVTSYKKRKARNSRGSLLRKSQVLNSDRNSSTFLPKQFSKSASDFGMTSVKLQRDDNKGVSQQLAQAVEVRHFHQNLHEYSILKLEQRIKIWEAQ